MGNSLITMYNCGKVTEDDYISTITIQYLPHGRRTTSIQKQPVNQGWFEWLKRKIALNKQKEDEDLIDNSDMNNNDPEDDGWIDLIEKLQEFRQGVIFYATGIYCNRYIAGTRDCLEDYLIHYLLYLRKFQDYLDSVPLYLQKTREYEEGSKLYQLALENYNDAND